MIVNAMNADTTATGHAPLPDWVNHVLQQVQRLDYGVVQITVHQGDVAQVDVTERRRFQSAGPHTRTSRFSTPTATRGGSMQTS